MMLNLIQEKIKWDCNIIIAQIGGRMQLTKEREQPITNSSHHLELPFDSNKEHFRNFPQLERKTSKRREVQEQRVIVMDLFKQLIIKINQGFTKVNTPLITKAVHARPPRIPKQPRAARKQNTSKQKKQNKAKKNDSEQNRLRAQKKEQMWSNYAVLMNYQIIQPEIDIHPPMPIVEQAQ